MEARVKRAILYAHSLAMSSNKSKHFGYGGLTRNANTLVSAQEACSIEAGLTPHVGEVLEVPTRDASDAGT
jgi:hypothetical protein